MPVETHRHELTSPGNTTLLDVTADVNRLLESGTIRNGVVTVFVIGSTAGLTTTEFEPGLAKVDFRNAFEKIAPEDGQYAHEETWHDDNGHSHIRASLVGPSLAIPLINGALSLGSWQQIVLMDFDTRRRQRQIIIQVVGEP